ncbi:hypothetical protein BGW41_002969 [Actinomortierella wolfii]|nr:hypothetical protein BGW41_002969 [Actinomortierella wolfii]
MTTLVSTLGVLALCLCIASVANAQSASSSAPSPAVDPAFVKHGSKLYILGGHRSTDLTKATDTIRQFSVLDLARTWSASSPAWATLSSSDLINTPVKAAISADGKTLIAFPSTGTGTGAKAYRYSFETATWSVSNAAIQRTPEGLDPVTASNTGNVYVLGGYSGPGMDIMDTYSFETDAITSTAMPALANQTVPSKTYYKAAWSQYRQSIVYFGGTNKAQDQTRLVAEYFPGNSTWGFPTTTGPIVSTLWHCSATNDDGTLLYVYGGIEAERPSSNVLQGLFILDLRSMTWRIATRGDNRVYSACAVAGDNFLVWGGAKPLGEDRLAVVDADKTNSPIMVYKTSMNAWVDTYTPPDSYLPSKPTISSTPEQPGAGSSSSSSPSSGGMTAAIAGSVAAIVLVVAVAGFIIWRIRRHSGTMGKKQRSTSHNSSWHPQSNSQSRRSNGRSGTLHSNPITSWPGATYNKDEY